jgi:hypothetical protein
MTTSELLRWFAIGLVGGGGFHVADLIVNGLVRLVSR